ncbi:MAG: glycosyltransferase [Dysgonamonadaceae bacterium]|jgi:glycosyltransferase involved in cell wall biosynthesis|nr:glycosyltransferase [Dysgonamonadaceae bacterium]
MKLSIITINLNNAEGLRKTIESVVSQTFSNYEYIVIDGGSTDGSTEIINLYESRMSYWVSEPDNGIYNAMNKGIKAAKGDYCLFLNSGDTLFDDMVLSHVFSMKLNFDLIYGDLYRIFPDGSADIATMPDRIDVIRMLTSTLTHPTTFIRRCLFDKYGLYREDLKIVSDWAFFLKIIAFGDITQTHINRIIASFSMDGLSTNALNLTNQERKTVINELFSPDLQKICFQYPEYRSFYYKNIFEIYRMMKKKYHRFLLNVFKMAWIYKLRIHPLIWCINKNVRIQKKNLEMIPLIIINYNRLRDLQNMISFFKKRGHKNIIIIDNASTYPPLLKYYEQIGNSITVERMDKNYGYMVLWRNKYLLNKYTSGYYIVSDSDIIPNDKLPPNYLTNMLTILDKNKNITKVGFALKIDDIPDTFPFKSKVLEWEKPLWEHPIGKDMYSAPIDTTFAIYYPYYVPEIDTIDKNFYKSIRIAGDYTAKHMGWYIDSNKKTEEEEYYSLTANSSASWIVK